MFDGLLYGLQQLDLMSMGVGIILTVLAFAVFRMKMWKRTAKTKEVK